MFSFNEQPQSQPSEKLLRIERYSHHLRLSGYQRSVRDHLLNFMVTLGEYGYKREGRQWVKRIVRVFAGATQTRSEINLHINDEPRLLHFLNDRGLKNHQIAFYDHPLYTPVGVEWVSIDQRTLYDYQVPIVDYICQPGKTKVVTLDPGRGKTFIATQAIARLGVRVFFCIKSMYIDKWINDFNNAFSLQQGELLVIRGKKALQNAMALAEAGELNASVILCSNTTFQQYLKDYERYFLDLEQVGFAFNPHVFFEKMGVGLRVVDELHETFHFNFRLDCYTHVPKTLGLTATLFSDQRFIEKVQNIAFPPHERYSEPKPDVYIVVQGLKYRIDNVNRRVHCINKQLKTYSHILFENSMLKQPALRARYFSMIGDIMKKRFVQRHEPGQKAIVYFSTVEMCTQATHYLSACFPHLSVSRYVSEDDYEDLFNHDLIVSTLKSLGTAMDVPGLRTILMTDALSSKQANVQCMGRLRRLKEWPEINPEFLFLICEDIERHLYYANKKQQDLQRRVLRFQFQDTGYRL